MKSMITALMLLSLAVGPVLAAGSPSFGTAQFGYRYGMPTTPGQMNITNPLAASRAIK
jgi:hypothetical protein